MSVEMSEMRQAQLLIHLITELMYSEKTGQQLFFLRCSMAELAVIACGSTRVFSICFTIRFIT